MLLLHCGRRAGGEPQDPLAAAQQHARALTSYWRLGVVLCRGLIILGSFSLAMCIFGIFHSCCTRCCLSVFLLVATLVTLAQLGLDITLFANLDGTVNNLVNAESGNAPAPNKRRSPPPPSTRRLL